MNRFNIIFPRIISLILILLPLIAILLLNSCSSTKYVPEGQCLLKNYKVNIDNKKVDNKELNNYVKPKPNKKVLGLRFYLSLYNLSGRKDNGFNRWLRKIGEEPVFYDSYDTEKNNKQIGLYLKNKGYYNANVGNTVKLRKKKARVIYSVETGRPYIIRGIKYHFEDTTLRSLILADTVNSILHPGLLFDVDLLQKERSRIEIYVKKKGYYNFNKEYVFYQVDSSFNKYQVDLAINIRKFVLRVEDYNLQVPHRKYKISKVFIYPDFDPKQALIDFDGYSKEFKRLNYENFEFLYSGELRANPRVITQSIYIIPGELYNLDDVTETYKHLSSLRIFKLVNIKFMESDPQNNVQQDYYDLNCQIELTPVTLQSYAVELEGTNSAGNIGVAGNVSYQHRNLFGGAENLFISVKGAIETLRESYEKGYGNMVEVGTEATITLPQFLLPVKTENFIRKYNPQTRLSLAYNYQNRPDYTRSVAKTTFGYTWKGSPFSTHILNPIDLNLVQLLDTTNNFWQKIEGTYLQHSYEDRLISTTNYSFIFNNQDIKKNKDFMYLRMDMETAGFFHSRVTRWVSEPNNEGHYEILGTEFAQYLKSNIDFRYYNVIDDLTSIVYRFFTGVAYPYGNSIAIPFEKQYFSGGANGIRAWQVRNLGPGSFAEEDTLSSYPNKTADIKLEGNIEYRFKLFWILEGALFVDAGNVWSINPKDDREGALFEWNRFYKEIAVGTGFGMRLDFSFFIARFDLGIKARDPALEPGDRWILMNRRLTRDDFLINIAIGYPF